MSFGGLRVLSLERLLGIAAEMDLEDGVRAACRRMVIASVGPTPSEMQAEFGLPADFEPTHPKMGLLMNETAQQARRILQSKQ